MAYWWEGDGAERYWAEIRWVRGIGRSLSCPAPPEDGSPHNPWYQLVGKVQPRDIVYHWNAREHRFVGKSRASSHVRQEGAEWIVELRDFIPIRAPVTLARVRELAPALIAVRDHLIKAHPDSSLFLPFQFRRDGLRLMSNYFAKLPKDAAAALFDETGLGEGDVQPPRTEDGPTAEIDDGVPARTGFLAPFRPKADTDYLARITGGIHRRGRTHETLVNTFAAWLESSGYEVGRNAVVDLGLNDPPVIIEAKVILGWPNAIRAAVGQLYEYRYFKIADPKAGLLFLASEPVPPEWLRYLERDRHIGAAWPEGTGFFVSPLARRMLRMDPKVTK